MIRTSWTRAASIEETLALWAASLREIKKRIRSLFKQERVATNVGLFLEGLLGDEQRKTGWMPAEAAGDPGPWRQQAILGRRDWDADALRDIVRDYVIEHFMDDDAVLVIDETGLLKQGKASCGVARQYRRLRCLRFAPRSFVHRLRPVSSEGMDRRSRSSGSRLRAPDAGFATKPKLATRMIARAIATSVPFRWVAGDTVYGVGDIEKQLRHTGKGYVLRVRSAHVFHSWGKRRSVAGSAADIAQTQCASDWERLSAGAGTKGPRLHDWCYLELADLDAEEFNGAIQGLWTRSLLIRRRIADDHLAFFTTWCPAATSTETLVAIEGHPERSRTALRPQKTSSDDHNESPSWHGWHRHVSLVMLAFAMMAVIRHRANPTLPIKTQRRLTAKTKASPPSSLIRWSIQEIRRIAIRLARKRIQPAHIIAWSTLAQSLTRPPLTAHFKAKRQLQC